MRDAEEMRDALEKEDEARQALRNDLEKEIIAQGKDLFREIDRNKSDIEAKLEREAKERDEDQKTLRQKVDDGINRLTDDLEGSKDMLIAKIGEECGNVRDN